jgi:hyaluronan synthase
LFETYEELELENPPRRFEFDLPGVGERFDPIALSIIGVGFVLVIFFTLKFRLLAEWIAFLQSTRFLRISACIMIVFGFVFVSGILFRTILWLRYKPRAVESPADRDWPRVSVIVPALNEEDLIRKSIDSIFASNYPEDKLEVIAINDGSSDLTLFGMLSAKRIYGERLRVISFRSNLGKRRALYSGLKIARGEFVVTVDADSKIGRSAIRNLVIPLMEDLRIGAVGGRVAVLNERQNLLTRMLAIRYALSFDYGRAYQSVYGTVFVCPGALTAYRKSVLRSFIRDWVHQSFMNTQCLHGEDRSLTTYILRKGYRTKYQSNAVVYTKVPGNFRQMNRMYVRWTRSYLRESIVFGGFMFSRYRSGGRLLPILDFIFLNSLHPFHLCVMGLLSYSFIVQPLFILRLAAFLTILSFFLSLFYLRTNRSWAFLYGIPYALITAFAMWWIVPFSALTIRNQSWLTRSGQPEASFSRSEIVSGPYSRREEGSPLPPRWTGSR